MKSYRLGVFAVLFSAFYSLTANAAVVGYFTDGNTSVTGPAAGISANGFTPVQITNISTFDLSTLDMLVINESDNGGPSGALTGRLGDITAWVNAGGKAIFHDRFVGTIDEVPQSNPFLLGHTEFLAVRDFNIDADINVIPPDTLVTDGPFGVINDTSLDNGTSSSHGFVSASSLSGTTNILQRDGQANEIVSLSYGLGDGFVYYSTIPLDFYLEGFGNDPPEAAMVNTYYPNVLAYMDSLGVEAVPEPASLALWGAGLLCSAFVARRRAKSRS